MIIIVREYIHLVIHFSFFCSDVHVEPHKKQLHVTLAYHFQTSHLPILEKLAKSVDVSSGCDWLAVLFSRDIRFANHEVDLLPLKFVLPLNTRGSRFSVQFDFFPSYSVKEMLLKIIINRCVYCLFHTTTF